MSSLSLTAAVLLLLVLSRAVLPSAERLRVGAGPGAGPGAVGALAPLAPGRPGTVTVAWRKRGGREGVGNCSIIKSVGESRRGKKRQDKY